jgi:hypothetical protein
VKPGLVVRARFAVAIVIGWGATTLVGISTALAAPNCNGFFSNSDGSWTPTHPILIGTPTSQTQIGPGDRLRAGAPGLSGRIGRYLDVHSRLGATAVQPLRIPKMP